MTTQERHSFWQQKITDWQRSELSGAAFCQQYELTYHQFVYWRQKLTQTTPPSAPHTAASAFLNVTRQPPPLTEGLTLALPGGMAITGLHAGNIALLGAILRQL